MAVSVIALTDLIARRCLGIWPLLTQSHLWHRPDICYRQLMLGLTRGYFVSLSLALPALRSTGWKTSPGLSVSDNTWSRIRLAFYFIMIRRGELILDHMDMCTLSVALLQSRSTDRIESEFSFSFRPHHRLGLDRQPNSDFLTHLSIRSEKDLWLVKRTICGGGNNNWSACKCSLRDAFHLVFYCIIWPPSPVW